MYAVKAIAKRNPEKIHAWFGLRTHHLIDTDAVRLLQSYKSPHLLCDSGQQGAGHFVSS